MRQKLPNIASNDGVFHDGNPTTGTLGTIVTAAWLNEVQATLQATFEEHKNVIALAGFTPNPAAYNQIAEAIKRYFSSRLTADTGVGSADLAFNAAGAKVLAQQIAQNKLDIGTLKSGKLDKTSLSDSVSSTAKDTAASSFAVKTANDNANTRVPIAGDVLITGTKTFFYQVQFKSSEAGVEKFARFGQNANDTFIQNPYSQRYLQLKNSGELQYQNQNVFVRGLQNPSFSDIENTPTTLAGYGVADFVIKNITTADNVSNYTADGIYAIVTGSALNLPTTGAYKLVNLAGSNVSWRHQLAIRAYSTDFYIRSQASNGGAFLPWERIPIAKEANLKSEHYATVTAHSGGWGGLMIESSTDSMRIEKSGTKLVFLRRDKATSSNIWTAVLQEKSGTLALLSDIDAFKNGNLYVKNLSAHNLQMRWSGSHLEAKVDNTEIGRLVRNTTLSSELKALVSRTDKSRTNTFPLQTTRSYTTTGSVTIYPDGRIVQTFHLKDIKLAWFSFEKSLVQGSEGYASPNVHHNALIQLWTAMPNKILSVNPQIIRNVNVSGFGSTTYINEAAEWLSGWQLFENENTKDRVNINLSRFRGGGDEYVDLYVVVEGY